jgi:hypothetical protein
MYWSQPPLHPYSTTPTNAGPGYGPPPEPRRADDEKDKPRQSLPSIHEALGNDKPLPYPGPPTSAPQQSHSVPPPHHISNSAGCPGAEGPRPPDPFPNGQPTNESKPYVDARMDKMNGVIPGHTFPGVSQNDFVKRHLDFYQVETSLIEVSILEQRRLIGY